METLITIISLSLGVTTACLILFGLIAVFKGLKSTNDKLFKILNLLGILVVALAVTFMFLIALHVFNKV